jgi:hypothetical protein
VVTGRVGSIELNRAVLEIAVRDGLGWPVGPAEILERVQLDGAAEDTSVKGQRLASGTGKVEVRRRRCRRCHASLLFVTWDR